MYALSLLFTCYEKNLALQLRICLIVRSMYLHVDKYEYVRRHLNGFLYTTDDDICNRQATVLDRNYTFELEDIQDEGENKAC